MGYRYLAAAESSGRGATPAILDAPFGAVVIPALVTIGAYSGNYHGPIGAFVGYQGLLGVGDPLRFFRCLGATFDCVSAFHAAAGFCCCFYSCAFSGAKSAYIPASVPGSLLIAPSLHEKAR